MFRPAASVHGAGAEQFARPNGLSLGGVGNQFFDLIGIKLRKSPSASVGARVVWSGREGLYGRPLWVWCGIRRATIKAHSAHPLPARPYGLRGFSIP